MAETDGKTTDTKNAPETFPGDTEYETVFYETDRVRADGTPTGGVDRHEILLEHNGFGFWRVANAGHGRWYRSRDELVQAIESDHLAGAWGKARKIEPDKEK